MAKTRGESSLVGELWVLIRQNKKYWLLPMIVVLLVLGLVVFFSGTAVAPFIYTLF